MSIERKFKLTTTSSGQSSDLAAVLAQVIEPPQVLELVGDLGGGKTSFVKGLARGLGVSQTVTSPTFTIHRSYPAPSGVTLEHYDLYRLDEDEVVVHDLAERAIAPRTITAIEWGQSVENILPADRLTVSFHYVDDHTRQLEFIATGPHSTRALERLEKAVPPTQKGIAES